MPETLSDRVFTRIFSITVGIWVVVVVLSYVVQL